MKRIKVTLEIVSDDDQESEKILEWVSSEAKNFVFYAHAMNDEIERLEYYDKGKGYPSSFGPLWKAEQ
ncbi:hypothetical protein J9305_18575 [Leptospira interrogans]|uniref:hypothetical protein n=1 Tax=Leptospira interrogans TaxID=173 RepID=UPI0002783C57|nr:hypothetical protein [Leptospira interrogans]EJP03617.1 hypothetical protein LEP1GSC007_1928 [Leptospira interrogans serovar Bulgarica str. Mallika]EKR17336.1 hypothetical protein LEP1GSC019_0080 [Leptospira interrogans serovar Pyrogenes str. 2006006960]UID85266.1 hypothetical protein J9305_18575 [Leptospira interrogans]